MLDLPFGLLLNMHADPEKKLWNLHLSKAECLDICWHKCLFVKPLVRPCFILKSLFTVYVKLSSALHTL